MGVIEAKTPLGWHFGHKQPRGLESATHMGALSPLVELRGITKRFPGVIACDRVDLQVYSGEIHALLGENGAGKTTLMHILYGLHQPDAGEIWMTASGW
jgi:ABC-type sugar transport system ATPase subunit